MAHLLNSTPAVDAATIGLWFLLMAAMPSSVLPARILLLPLNTYSHVKLMTLSSTQLLRSGHHVWMLSSLPPPDYDRSAGTLHWIPADLPSLGELLGTTSCLGDSRSMYRTFFNDAHRLVLDHCHTILKDRSLMADLMTRSFDLAIVDGLELYRCGAVVPYRLGVPYMTLSLQHNGWLAGVPAMPSIEPHQLTSFSSDMPFHQRFANVLIFVATAHLFPLDGGNSDVERLLADDVHSHERLSSVKEVAANSLMWLVFSNSVCLDYSRATAPHYREISLPTPYHDAARVSPRLKAFVDGAESGVVLVVFGCLVSHGVIPAEIRAVFFDAFRSRPRQRFVMRYSGVGNATSVDDVAVPANILLIEWVPVDELLRHPNTRVLVSHGGAVIMNEAAYHGVPVLTIPFLGDQGYNAKRAAEHGWGITVSKNGLTSRILGSALDSLLHEPSYKEAAVFCRMVLQSASTGEDSVAFWVDKVLQNGRPHPARPGHGLPSVTMLLMLDVLGALFVLAAVALYLTCRMLMRCAGIWCRAKRKYPRAIFWVAPSTGFFFALTMIHSISTTHA